MGWTQSRDTDWETPSEGEQKHKGLMSPPGMLHQAWDTPWQTMSGCIRSLMFTYLLDIRHSVCCYHVSLVFLPHSKRNVVPCTASEVRPWSHASYCTLRRLCHSRLWQASQFSHPIHHPVPPHQGCGLRLAGPGTLVWPVRTVLVLVLMPAPARRLDPSKPFQSCSWVPFLGPSTRDAAQIP